MAELAIFFSSMPMFHTSWNEDNATFFKCLSFLTFYLVPTFTCCTD
ncbi:hypothetical protein SMI10712_01622 [Streptococcus mitis]|uniref:Uncharacterized protein n=1 Tax=Streptococcus mitis TaxID=28037 RepID=A0A150NJZ3_STRMT|nr:hypothetical protein SMI10712_01622 [Streptococcus mitis]